MNKFLILTLVFTTVVVANHPEWYPENASEIEVQCLKEYPISAEAKSDIRNIKLTDVPNMSSLLYCIASGHNVYKPGDELEPERLAYGLYRSLKLDCDIDLVRSCLDEHREENEKNNHEDFMYLSIQCIFESSSEKCTKSV